MRVSSILNTSNAEGNDGTCKSLNQKDLHQDSANKVIVVYVCRYQDEDSEGKFTRFVDSYKNHPAGYKHDLFIIKKGFQEQEKTWETWTRQLEGIPFQIRPYPDRHFVFGYIRNLMEEFPDHYILVCNATSEILVDHWLDLYMRHANPRRILGAMGGYNSWAGNACPTPLTLRTLFWNDSTIRRQWWLSVRGYDLRTPFHVKYFNLRPNPYLRTVNFMVPPRLLEQIFYWPRAENILSKVDELYFESGKCSLTVQSLRAGIEPFVVAANGKRYGIREWSQLGGRDHSGKQKTLIIGDHRSRKYGKTLFIQKIVKRLCEKTYSKAQIDHWFEQVMNSDLSLAATYYERNTER